VDEDLNLSIINPHQDASAEGWNDFKATGNEGIVKRIYSIASLIPTAFGSAKAAAERRVTS
jgi:hypothetical protein